MGLEVHRDGVKMANYFSVTECSDHGKVGD